MDEKLNDQLPPEIAGALRALDRDAAKSAASVDAERVASRVLARLREEPVTPIRATRWNLRVLRIAAVLAILVAAGALARRIIVAPHGGAEVALSVIPASLDTASVDERALSAAVDEAHAAAGGVLPATTVLVEDLNELELEALLTTMNSPEGSL